jgi:hypothetical protein
MPPNHYQPLGPPVALGKITKPEGYRELAAEEAALAKSALTNGDRAQHYAMAAYYTRLADAQEKLATTMDPTGDSDA